MAIIIDGKVYRNLEEQVRKNKEDISNIGIISSVTFEPVEDLSFIDNLFIQTIGNSVIVKVNSAEGSITEAGTYTIGTFTGLGEDAQTLGIIGDTLYIVNGVLKLTVTSSMLEEDINEVMIYAKTIYEI